MPRRFEQGFGDGFDILVPESGRVREVGGIDPHDSTHAFERAGHFVTDLVEVPDALLRTGQEQVAPGVRGDAPAGVAELFQVLPGHRRIDIHRRQRFTVRQVGDREDSGAKAVFLQNRKGVLENVETVVVEVDRHRAVGKRLTAMEPAGQVMVGDSFNSLSDKVFHLSTELAQVDPPLVIRHRCLMIRMDTVVGENRDAVRQCGPLPVTVVLQHRSRRMHKQCPRSVCGRWPGYGVDFYAMAGLVPHLACPRQRSGHPLTSTIRCVVANRLSNGKSSHRPLPPPGDDGWGCLPPDLDGSEGGFFLP